MGPYNEDRQIQRAGAIERLLKNNPQLSEDTRNMWQKHLKDLSVSEEEYNAKVKSVYGKMTRGFKPYE